MKYNQKFALVLTYAALLGQGFAETDSPLCCPEEVYSTSPCYTFSAQAKALWLKPGGNLDYAAEATPLPLPSPNWNIYSVDPDYHFAFELGMETVFSNLNNNLALDWTHFYSKDSTARTVFIPTNMIGPFFEIGPDAALYTQASGKATFFYDSVSLDYGKFLSFGNRLDVNLFAGVNLVYIKETLHSVFSNADYTTVRIIDTPSSYLGAGPEVGVHFSYDIWHGFSLTGGTSAAMLVGRARNHTDYKAFSPALESVGVSPAPNRQSTTVQEKTIFVPACSGRLGLSYAWTFGNNHTLKFEAGYEARIYLDALQTIDMGSEVVTPPVTPDTVGVFARTFERHSYNFSLSGPYASLTYEF